MEESASTQVQRILAETARRKALWIQMQAAALEAVHAVTVEARRRRIPHQNWLGGAFPGDTTIVTFLSEAGRRAQDAGSMNRLTRHESHHSFVLYGSGTLRRPNKDTPYEGYPDLVEADVDVFSAAAVNRLMAALNAHIDATRRERRRKE